MLAIPPSAPASRNDIVRIYGGIDPAPSPENWLGLVKAKLAQGKSAVIQVWGDSTTRHFNPADANKTPTRYVAQWARALVSSSRVPAEYGVRVFAYDSFASQKYELVETVRTSSGGLWLDFYQASVSGSIPRYFMHNYFFRGLAAVCPDALLIGHGINMAGFLNIEGEIAAAVHMYRTVNPQAPILWLTQHPLQGNSNGETSWRPAIISSAFELGIAVDDSVYKQFLQAGKPDSLYAGDGIHESTGPGCALYVEMLTSWWDRSVPGRGLGVISPFCLPAGQQQILKNGDFSQWSVATQPDSWVVGGAVTLQKDISLYATPQRPFSMKMLSQETSSAGGFIEQAVDGVSVRQYLLGRPVTACARIWRDTGGSSPFRGRLAIRCSAPSIGGMVNAVITDSNIVQTNGFGWFVTKPFVVPTDVTALSVRVYADSGSAPDAGKFCWVDQVSLVPGRTPRPWF